MKRLFLPIVAIMAIGGLIFWQSMPGEDHSGHGSANALAEVTVPELTQTAQRGRQAFDANCSGCHGVNATGVDGAGPPLVHIVYEPNHHGDMSFYMAVRQGVRAHHWPFGNMPPVEGVSDTEVATIIAYVRELQRANGIF